MALTNCTPLSQWQPKARLSSVCNPADASFDFTWAAQPCGPQIEGMLGSTPIGLDATSAAFGAGSKGTVQLLFRETSGAYSTYGRIFRTNVYIPGNTGKFLVRVFYDEPVPIQYKAPRLLFVPSVDLLACTSTYSSVTSGNSTYEPDEAVLDSAFISAGAILSAYFRHGTDVAGQNYLTTQAGVYSGGGSRGNDHTLYAVDTLAETISVYHMYSGSSTPLNSHNYTFSAPGLSGGFYVQMYAAAGQLFAGISFAGSGVTPFVFDLPDVAEFGGYRWLA